MTLLSRSQILSARLPFRDVDVPELGGSVRIQQMSVGTRVEYLETLRVNQRALLDYELDQGKPKAKRQNLPKPAEIDQAQLAIVKCLVDESGVRVFNDSDLAELDTLGFVVVRRLWEAVLEMNKFGTTPTAAVETEKKD